MKKNASLSEYSVKLFGILNIIYYFCTQILPMRKDKVIHVELIEPYKGMNHYYFGSMAAIYDTLHSDIIGISLTSLWSHFHSGCSEYRTRKAIIRKGTILRKSGNRHKC